MKMKKVEYLENVLNENKIYVVVWVTGFEDIVWYNEASGEFYDTQNEVGLLSDVVYVQELLSRKIIFDVRNKELSK